MYREIIILLKVHQEKFIYLQKIKSLISLNNNGICKISRSSRRFFYYVCIRPKSTLRNFVKVFKSFENLIVGLICQIVILPVIGLILISLIDLTPEFQFGIFIINHAICRNVQLCYKTSKW